MLFHDLGVSCCFVSDLRINHFLPNHGSNQKRIILESSDRTQAVVSVVGIASPVIVETAFQYKWNMFKKGFRTNCNKIFMKADHSLSSYSLFQALRSLNYQMVGMTRKWKARENDERIIWKKEVTYRLDRLIFAFALSHGPNHLGAWNKLTTVLSGH